MDDEYITIKTLAQQSPVFREINKRIFTIDRKTIYLKLYVFVLPVLIGLINEFI